MRNAYEVLHQKETDLARVRREIRAYGSSPLYFRTNYFPKN